LLVLLHARVCTTNGSHTSYLEQQHKTGTAEVYLTTVRGQAITFRNSVYMNTHTHTHTHTQKSTAVYHLHGAETWTLRAADQKYL